MNSSKIIHQAKLNNWAVAIRQKQESSMSVTSWCKQNHLSTTQFYYWKRMLKDQFVESHLPDIVPSPLRPHNRSTALRNVRFLYNQDIHK